MIERTKDKMTERTDKDRKKDRMIEMTKDRMEERTDRMIDRKNNITIDRYKEQTIK